jgi:hypothetical protein
MIKIYGERNSCNNYLVKLIEKNFRVEVTKSHQFPTYTNGDIHIILVKNPYAWLLSLWKKPHGSFQFRQKYLKLRFDEFLRTEWRGYPNSVERYSDIYSAYIDFLEQYGNAYLIKSEDLQKNPREVLEALSNHYDLKMRPFKNIEKEVNSGGNLIGDGFNRVDYYVKELWREKLSKNDIQFINKNIDSKIFNYFNYEQL